MDRGSIHTGLIVSEAQVGEQVAAISVMRWSECQVSEAGVGLIENH